MKLTELLRRPKQGLEIRDHVALLQSILDQRMATRLLTGLKELILHIRHHQRSAPFVERHLWIAMCAHPPTFRMSVAGPRCYSAGAEPVVMRERPLSFALVLERIAFFRPCSRRWGPPSR
jgi:hypothetical protein